MTASICLYRMLACCALALASAASLAQQAAASAPDAAPAGTRPRFTVIELPPAAAVLPATGPQRAHHALSIATDAPKPWLSSLGIDATDCTMRLRFPSRIKQSRGSGSGVEVLLAAQVGMGCRF